MMKHVSKTLALMLALVLCLAACPAGQAAVNTDYVQTLFDHSRLIEIDIIMDDEAWNHMIATASAEEYSACDLMVNGVLYENVAIRPKGNSSLASVSRSGSERFSWRIKFDKYEKKRTCDGLDILILNNGFNDASNMKEAIAYDMYAFLDADASLYNYAVVYHNGEYFGVYLALEAVDESFAERNYGHDDGNLYKPELNSSRKAETRDGEAQDADADDGDSFGGASDGQSAGGQNAAPDQEGASNGGTAAPRQDDQENGGQDQASGGAQAGGDQASGGQGGDGQDQASGGAQGGSGGGSASDYDLAKALNYVGDDLDTYDGIWSEAKFDSDEEDYARVVEALKHVSQRDHIGDYVDVDNVLKYMAIQAFIFNQDGLTDTETHNYYLYEEDGKVNLIPWDMNEAFSVSGNGNDFVNFPIDTPFTGDLSQRDFFMALLEDEWYLAQYHEYLRMLCEEYVQGGRFDETYSRIRSQIDALVETDPTYLSTYERYTAAAASLKLAVQLRAQGVLGQLSGDIPSTRDGQEAAPDLLMDVSGEDLSGFTGGGSWGGNANGDMPGGRE